MGHGVEDMYPTFASPPLPSDTVLSVYHPSTFSLLSFLSDLNSTGPNRVGQGEIGQERKNTGLDRKWCLDGSSERYFGVISVHTERELEL